MKVVEHHRTHTIHLTEDKQEVGTRTICGIELPTTPGIIFKGGELCNNCRRIV